MGKTLRKYMDVDVIAFLEEKMKSNTKHYQSDFEIDKQMIERFAQSGHKEDKTLLWLSRPYGTQCVKEYEAFLKDTGAYTAWQYYAYQSAGDNFVAFAVELKSAEDGVILGNLYELDYIKHAEMVKREAQPVCDVIKTFEDGHVAQAPFAISSYGYWLGLVDEHGPIVDSRSIPEDKEMLLMVLAEQKRARDKMKPAKEESRTVDDILANASQRSEAAQAPGDKEKVIGKEFANL